MLETLQPSLMGLMIQHGRKPATSIEQLLCKQAQPLQLHQYLVIRHVLIHSLEPADLALAGLAAPCENLAAILDLQRGAAQSVKLDQRFHCILWL